LGEALEVAERHNLVGEACSAADLILSIHIEREDLSSAGSWVARAETLAARVNARYARASIAINKSIMFLLDGDPSSAHRAIAPFAEGWDSDPLVRQRLLYLSILARVATARGDHRQIRELTPALKAALRMRQSSGAYDFHVVSYAQALSAVGETQAATDFVAQYVTKARRYRAPLSGELRRFWSREEIGAGQ
jgi:hypothetical protein